MEELRMLKFPKSITPREGKFKDPLLTVFEDRSRDERCYLVHIKWEREDGSVGCKLVTGKTKIALKLKITKPAWSW
jgi:hypothetical protein